MIAVVAAGLFTLFALHEHRWILRYPLALLLIGVIVTPPGLAALFAVLTINAVYRKMRKL